MVELYAGQPFGATVYPDVLCASSCDPLAGDPVAVPASGFATANFQLLELGTLAGTVVADRTGAPVAFTRVWIYDETWRAVLATAVENGSFASAGLAAGRYFVYIERSGNLMGQLFDGLPCIRLAFDSFRCDRTQARPVVVASEMRTDIEVRMQEGARLRGKIRDAGSGQALPAVTLDLLDASLDELELYAESDDAGEYLIEGIPPGTYFLRASAVDYPTTLWPGVPCFGQCSRVVAYASQLSLSADSSLSVDLAIGRLGEMAATVKDRLTGQGLENAEIRVYPADLSLVGGLGGFMIQRLPPLDYYVEARVHGYRPQIYRNVDPDAWEANRDLGTRIAVPPGGRGQVLFELEPLPSLTVKVHLPNGAFGCDLALWRRLDGGSLERLPEEFCRGEQETRVLLPGPGTYYLGAFGDFAPTVLGVGSCYFSDSQNFCDFSRATPLVMAEGEKRGPIELAPEAAARIEASIREPGSSAFLPGQILFEDGQGRRIETYGQSSIDFDRLPPGRYYLAAFAAPSHQNLAYPNVPCNRFTCDPQQGQPIDLAPGAEFSTVFQPAPLAPLDTCSEEPTALCVQQDRFRITADWKDFQAAEGHGRLLPLGSESGYSYFFSPGNIELMVKVLNACSPELGQHFWVFAAGLTNVEVSLQVEDTWTGASKRYDNPLGNVFQPILDIDAFATCAAPEPAPQPVFRPSIQPVFRPSIQSVPPIPPAAPGAEISSIEYCWSGSPFCIAGRYEPSVTFIPPGGGPTAAYTSTLTADTKVYTFFSASNFELLVKVLDACQQSGHYWFFAAGLTDVPVRIQLTDLATEQDYVWESAGGPFQPIFDLTTLPCATPAQ